MDNTAESREKRLQALLSEDRNPVAMPTPFGYIREETLADLIKSYKDGMEDCGDTLSRQVGLDWCTESNRTSSLSSHLAA